MPVVEHFGPEVVEGGPEFVGSVEDWSARGQYHPFRLNLHERSRSLSLLVFKEMAIRDKDAIGKVVVMVSYFDVIESICDAIFAGFSRISLFQNLNTHHP